jgi:hypothetical protein
MRDGTYVDIFVDVGRDGEKGLYDVAHSLDVDLLCYHVAFARPLAL